LASARRFTFIVQVYFFPLNLERSRIGLGQEEHIFDRPSKLKHLMFDHQQRFSAIMQIRVRIAS
jgi:hypothetical protein